MSLLSSPTCALGFVAMLASLLPSCGAESKPQIIAAGESDAHLEALWKTVLRTTPDGKPVNKKREWKMLTTTWLPDEWPPSPRTVWTRYAYGLDLSLDGASDVSAPFARIEHRTGDDARVVVVSMADKLKVIAVHPVRPHGGWRYTLDDEKRVLRTALGLRSAPPAGVEKELLRYFSSWQLGSAEIAAHVRSRHRAFFDWTKARAL